MRRIGLWSAALVLTLTLGAAESKTVTYEAFGAKGDGKTNDHEAIRKAHEYANEHNLPVRASDTATYYIGDMTGPAIIRTDTHWGKAKFIIDDTLPEIKTFRQPIFRIAPTEEEQELKNVKPVKVGQTRFPHKLRGPALVILYNDNVKQFIRYGGNANNGTPQQDLFIVDKNGAIHPDTPVVWDFKEVTRAVAYPIDTKPLKVSGGNFTTLANKREGRHIYFGRGLTISRSNTTVEGVRHDVVEGGGIDSWPYTGFINVQKCAFVTIRDCFVTGRKLYSYPLPDSPKRKTTGTYDISGGSAACIAFINVRQLNDIMDSAYWGVMGTNFCKALLLENCRLSRFDAHQGVTNATIRNTTVGYMGINAIGFGTFLLENTTSHSNRMVNFRSDYGATWRGTFILKNCTLAPQNANTVNVFVGTCTPSHDFGYPCSMPEKIVIANLKFDLSKSKAKEKTVAIFDDMNPKNDNDGAPYPYAVTKTLVVDGLSGVNSDKLLLSRNPRLFRDIVVTGRDAKRFKR